MIRSSLINVAEILGIRRLVGLLRAWNQYQSIKKLKSRLPSSRAAEFSAYLTLCQKSYTQPSNKSDWVTKSRDEFNELGFTSIEHPTATQLAPQLTARIQELEINQPEFWQNRRCTWKILQTFPELITVFQDVIEPFLNDLYQAHFKLFYGVLEKSIGNDTPRSDGQIWHSDGGPGTCTNLMYYLTESSKECGALELVPWKYSLPILKTEVLTNNKQRKLNLATNRKGAPLTRMEHRAVQSELMTEEIEQNCSDKIVQPCGPKGLIVPFLNNTLHRGGYPEIDRIRYVFIFHCYPAIDPPPYNRYLSAGIEKIAGMPASPGDVR